MLPDGLNNHKETANFLKSAIIKRIAGEYTAVKTVEVGEYIGIRFKSEDEDAYVWTIYRADGRWLNVIQAYYPSDHTVRLSAAVQAVVSGVPNEPFSSLLGWVSTCNARIQAAWCPAIKNH